MSRYDLYDVWMLIENAILNYLIYYFFLHINDPSLYEMLEILMRGIKKFLLMNNENFIDGTFLRLRNHLI